MSAIPPYITGPNNELILNSYTAPTQIPTTLGTPDSGNLINCYGYPLATETSSGIVSGVGGSNLNNVPTISQLYDNTAPLTAVSYTTTPAEWYDITETSASFKLSNATVKGVYGGNKLTKIASSSFRSCTSLISASLPFAIDIGNRSFDFCTALNWISIPSATDIRDSAFENCNALTSISAPFTIRVGNYSFNSCNNLTSVTMPNATNIGTSSFEDCDFIVTMSMPRVTHVGSRAFYDCDNLISASFPSATHIGSRAFYSNRNFASVYCPLVTNIGDYAFAGDDQLTTISLNSASIIGDHALKHTAITSAIAPAVTTVGSNGFYGCAQLTTLDLPEATSIGSFGFYQCTSLLSASLPKMTNIDIYAFANCSALTTMEVPLLPDIKQNTFDGCSALPSILLPATTIIGNQAFRNCTSLTNEVYLNAPMSGMSAQSLSGSSISQIHIRPYPNSPTGWVSGSGQTIGGKSGISVIFDWHNWGLNYPNPILNLYSIDIPRIISGDVTLSEEKDVQYSYYNSPVTYSDYQMNLLTTEYVNSNIIWTSSNEDVATVDADGFVTYISSGTSTITANIEETSASIDIPFSATYNQPISDIIQYIAGSLARELTVSVDNAIQGKSNTGSLLLYTTQNHASASYIRNTNCWCNDISSSLSCISPWNSIGGTQMAGTAISPLHIIFAAHYQIPTGATIRFITGDNQVVNRTMIDKLTHPSYSPYYPDITIGLLDSPLPVSIKPAKVLPTNWATYLPSLSQTYTVPVLCLDQFEQATIADLYELNTSAKLTYPNQLNSVKRAEFYNTKITGDSGNPMFLRINNELVLLSVLTFGGAGVGTNISSQIPQINTMMNQLGGGYTLSEINLSTFTAF